jgi:hypothetical protein
MLIIIEVVMMMMMILVIMMMASPGGHWQGGPLPPGARARPGGGQASLAFSSLPATQGHCH